MLTAISALGIIFCMDVESFSTLSEDTKPTVDMSIYGHIVQVGWVVKDIDRVVDYWEKLGLKNVRRFRVSESVQMYRGKKYSVTQRQAFADIGDVQIEWVQPIKGTSACSEFLEKHGEGVSHLAYAATSPEQFDEQIRYFESKGIAAVQGNWKSSKEDGRFTYVDTAPKGGGLDIELLYFPGGQIWGAAKEVSPNEYPFNKIHHYAFVVRDVRQVGAFYESLGFGGMPVDHNVSLDRVYRGKPGKFEMDLGWGRFGDVIFEWIQPVVGPSVYDEALKARGEGFHHLAFEVRDMDEAIKLLGSKGAPVSQAGGWDSPTGKGRFAYLDTEPYGGVTLELIWNQPADHGQ
jgi:catechol 2,3-dioxygenase-like lactoylglutathione lyase family enzyme